MPVVEKTLLRTFRRGSNNFSIHAPPEVKKMTRHEKKLDISSEHSIKKWYHCTLYALLLLLTPLCRCSIHATNDDRGRKGVSWTKEVTVFIGDVSVQLLQDWVVKVCANTANVCLGSHKCVMHPLSCFCTPQVNDEVVTLPFLKEPEIYVERQTNTILLNTNIGLKVQAFVSFVSLSLSVASDWIHTYTPTDPPSGAVEWPFAPRSECARLLQGPHLWSLWKLQQLLPGRPANAQRTNQPVRV